MTHQGVSRPDLVVYAARPRSSLHAVIAPYATACLAGTLLTDIAYWQTAEMMWANFSSWLISAGVVLIFVAALAGIVDFFRNRSSRGRIARDPAYDERIVLERRPVFPHVIGTILVLVIATANMFIHTRDAWTSVVPWGLALSALTVVILIVTGWLGKPRSNPTRVGVSA
jgi:uncharacterized membrane protein